MKKNKALNKIAVLLLCVVMAMVFYGCGSADDGESERGTAPQIAGLTYTETVELDYAECFDIYKYEDGYAFIDVYDDAQYLLVPEGGDVPDGLDDDVIVIETPVENIYLAATSAMSLFDAMGALDNVTMSSVEASSWTVENAAAAMNEGSIVYAGKYSSPDYELILDNECGLAIESTMIYHSPEVKEMIEDLDIPVFVDRSSYETSPLGRTEWIKLYGVMTGHEDEAAEYFESQKEMVAGLDDFEDTGKTVAFFYVTTDGKVVVRSSSDYISAMIEMAGGDYVFDDLNDDEGSTSISMSMETFYDGAADADYIIYNGNIDSTVQSIDDLIEKDSVFEDFKAVKSGNCWKTGSSLYQRSDAIGQMILEFNAVFTDSDTENLEFLTKME